MTALDGLSKLRTEKLTYQYRLNQLSLDLITFDL
jgi:hypothetical protein